ncbi:MAG: DUF3450 family protein [Deltaproteobacteria bacterium]|nr:DUF3450 family protein [Deltaproteobacteria bacterium]
MNKLYTIALIVTIVLCFTVSTTASPVEYGKQLTNLRTAVDELESRLERIRSETQAERVSLLTQKGDLEIMLSKERVRQKTLRRLRAKQLAEQRKSDSWSAQLMQPALDAAERLRVLIRTSLPLKRKQRLDAVDEIVDDLKGPMPDPEVALSRLWQLLEDELKLTAESGLQRQVVEVRGKRLLVEVVHLGMGVLYFKTEDDKYGWAVSNEDGQHTFEILSDERRVEAVERLFEALRKQIRKGYFQLPLPALLQKEVTDED